MRREKMIVFKLKPGRPGTRILKLDMTPEEAAKASPLRSVPVPLSGS